jgi:hypothetical protein
MHETRFMRLVVGFVSVGLLIALSACGSEPQSQTDAPLRAEALGASGVSDAPGSGGTRSASPTCAMPRAREIQFSRDVEPILMSGCSGEFCHGMHMTSAARAYSFLVGQSSFECDDARPLVSPGDPEKSYLMDKVLGRNLCAGHAMPRGFENRLSPQEVRTLNDWICEGAPND